MNYHVNKTDQLAEAVKKGYGSLASRLRAEGVPTRQHNVNVKPTPAKKAAAKKATAKKSAKPAAKKATAKKTTGSAAKKAAAKKS